jgi:hypothetical protein
VWKLKPGFSLSNRYVFRIYDEKDEYNAYFEQHEEYEYDDEGMFSDDEIVAIFWVEGGELKSRYTEEKERRKMKGYHYLQLNYVKTFAIQKTKKGRYLIPGAFRIDYRRLDIIEYEKKKKEKKMEKKNYLKK